MYQGTIDPANPVNNGEASMDASERAAWFNEYEAAGAHTGFYHSRLNGGGNRASSDEPVSGGDQVKGGLNDSPLFGGSGARQSLEWGQASWPNIADLQVLSSGTPLGHGIQTTTVGESFDLRYLLLDHDHASTVRKKMMLPTPLPINEALSLYILGEELVLFSKRSRQLYGLDRTTTVALLRLAQGEAPEAVSRGMGLMTGDAGGVAHVVEELAALLAGKEPFAGVYLTDLSCPPVPPAHGDDLPRYRLLETVFAIHGPDWLLREWVTPYIAHLGTSERGRTDLLVSVEAEGPAWSLRLNGAPQGSALPPERILPLLQGRLRQFAYQSRVYLLTMHAAAVTGGGRTLVLAGRSGSGKSTLAATLLARGYKLISDEPAVIDPSNGEVLPVPLGLGLKAGSWPAVLPDYPELDRLPVHVRFGGQQIRYVLPGHISSSTNGAGHPATHLIFPVYRSGSAGRLEPLSPVQGLRAIAEAGYQVPGLDEERVARILGWLGGLACHAMSYSSTAEALALLESTLK